MSKISGALVCFNEQTCIRRALENLSRFCDEIVVYDSYSTDDTLKIVKDYDVRLFQHEFDNHRDQKNRAIEQCKNEWVFLLDADEYLSNGLVNELSKEETLAYFDSIGVDAVGIPRYNLQDGTGPRGWPDIQTRLFRSYVRHIGHPFHHQTTGNAKKPIILGHDKDTPDPKLVIFHDKTLEQQKERNRLYYYMRPGDYKTVPEGAEDLKVPAQNYTNGTVLNVYRDYISKEKL